MILDRVCKECGSNFKGGPRAWYCPDCRAERTAKTNQEYRERKARGNSRTIGGTYICELCGEPYTLASGLQRFCDRCGPINKANTSRRMSLAWYHNVCDVEQRSAKRRAHYAKNATVINIKRHYKSRIIKLCFVKNIKGIDIYADMGIHAPEQSDVKAMMIDSGWLLTEPNTEHPNGISSLISAADITLSELSRLMDIPFATLSHWEKGERQMPLGFVPSAVKVLEDKGLL